MTYIFTAINAVAWCIVLCLAIYGACAALDLALDRFVRTFKLYNAFLDFMFDRMMTRKRKDENHP